MIQVPLRATLLATGLLGCALLLAPAARAQDAATLQYQQDVQRCHNTPGIDVEACLKEAGAALQASRQDNLTDPSAQAEMRNRRDRCNSLPADQREECLKLMENGNTRTQGSVESGGILRETTITIPAPGSGS
jgi:hypothetical protein